MIPLDQMGVTDKDGFEAKASIVLKNSNSHEFQSDETQEILRVFGSHITRYNQSRVKLVAMLRSIWDKKSTQYDSKDPAHEEKLVKLWNLLCPGEPLATRITPKWGKIGFQGSDPATDFRGGGIQSLDSLIFYAEHHTEKCRDIVSKDKEYPFAVAGINVNQLVLTLLAMNKDSVNCAAGDIVWESPLFHFLEHQTRCNPLEKEADHPFEEMFCITFQVLDRFWDEQSATYMDFPKILEMTKVAVSNALATLSGQPTPSFGKLRQLLRESGGVGDAYK